MASIKLKNNKFKRFIIFSCLVFILFEFTHIIVFGSFNFVHFPNSASNDQDKAVKMTFAGDIMLAETIGKKIEQHGVNFPFEATIDYLKQSDYKVGNLECVISTQGEPKRRWEFEADPSVVEGLKYADFNLLNLANNHILDYGAAALNDTISNLENYNISYVGLHANQPIENSSGKTKRPLVVDLNGLQFAFLSYLHNYVDVWYDCESYYQPMELSKQNLFSEIKYVKDNYPNAYIIVQIHWRINPQYNLTANNFQKDYCHYAINTGADLLLCHGPHVMQEIETYRSEINTNHWGLIYYCLGNYVFHDSEPLTHRGFLTTITFTAQNMTEFNLLPIHRENYQYIPAGDIQSFTITPELELNWTNYDQLFQFSTQNSIQGYSLIYFTSCCSLIWIIQKRVH